MRLRNAALLALAVLVAGLMWWGTRRPEPVEVAVAPVQRGTVRAAVSNTRAGTVEACNRARLAPIRGGLIAALRVSEGDRVEAGQVLLELWNEDIRASLALARQERRAAVARAEQACSEAEVAERDAGRMERLRQEGLTSEGAADTATGGARSTRAACTAARNMIGVSDAQIALIEAQLEQTIVRAPFAGTIAELNGEVGEVVTPSPVGVPTLPAVDLIDASCLYVTAPIDEVDAPRIRAGMSAAITLDAFPGRVFPATVRRVAPYVLDLAKQARTVDIEAEFDAPEAGLLPGYSADVEVTLDEHAEVLFVPTQAVLEGERVLVLGDDGILASRTIEPGLANWQITEVVTGLREGERIVLSVDRAGVVAGAAALAAAP